MRSLRTRARPSAGGHDGATGVGWVTSPCRWHHNLRFTLALSPPPNLLAPYPCRAGKRAREELAKAAAAKEVADCTFRPAINPRSAAIAAEKLAAEKLAVGTVSAVAIATGEVGDGAAPTAGTASAARVPRYERLYAEAQERRLAAVAASEAPAAWHGCTFQPDIGANALRPARDASMDDFFDRLHKQGAAARVRAAGVAHRVAAAMAAAAAPAVDAEGAGTLPAAGMTHHGLALHAAALQAQAARREAEVTAQLAAQRLAATKHTSTGSERLLLQMRRRALARIFSLLVSSMALTPAQRDAEAAEQAQVDAALHVALGADGTAAFAAPGAAGRPLPCDPTTGLPRLSAEELADLLAAVDAHAGQAADMIDPAHYEAVVTDAAVEAARGVVLDVDAAWLGVLHPALAACVRAALNRLRATGSAPAPTSDDGSALPIASVVSFETFCSALGGVLEDVGGGPHVYMLAKRAARLRDRSGSRGPLVRHRSAGGLHTSPMRSLGEGADGATPEDGGLRDPDSAPAFQPTINPRSRALAEEAERRVAAGGDVASAGASSKVPVHERLLRKADEYAERLRVAEVAAARREMEQHTFHPQPQHARVAATAPSPAPLAPGTVPTPALLPAVSHGVLVAQVQELRKRNADLAVRARAALVATVPPPLPRAPPPATTAASTTVILTPPPTSPPRAAVGSHTSRAMTATVSLAGALAHPRPRDGAGWTALASASSPPPQRVATGPHPGDLTFGYTPAHAVEVENAPPPATGVVGGAPPLPATAQRVWQVSSKLSGLSMAELEARIDKLLTVDPATEARTATTLARSVAGGGGGAGGLAAGSTVKALDMRS